MPPIKDPQSLSMESLIFHADSVLDTVLHKHATEGAKRFFKNCAGIVILHALEAGFFYNGSVGSGVLFVKNDKEEGDSFVWSRPVGCFLAEIGFGLSFGGAGKDLLIFLPSQKAVQSFLKDGLRLGGKAQATLGLGRESGWAFGAGKGAKMNQVATFAMTGGAFISLALEGMFVGPQAKVNNRYYANTGVDPAEIVDPESTKVTLPQDKETLLPQVYKKLAVLCGGDESIPPTPDEVAASKADPEEKASAREAAVQADQEIVEDKNEDVVEMSGSKAAAGDTTEEAAAKESA